VSVTAMHVHTLCLPFLSLSFNSFFSPHTNPFTTLLLSHTLRMHTHSLFLFCPRSNSDTGETALCNCAASLFFFSLSSHPLHLILSSPHDTHAVHDSIHIPTGGNRESHVHGERGELIITLESYTPSRTQHDGFHIHPLGRPHTTPHVEEGSLVSRRVRTRGLSYTNTHMHLACANTTKNLAYTRTEARTHA